ncbi:polyadenylate binding domain-containing protein [Hellea balneolensis]|uniref:hypothetical protein n=1 Tax=Hellea balneolensis TaxID=287478 RepID=UPI0003F6DDCB|nr:hypothetical protein [Hellea balneolensis]
MRLLSILALTTLLSAPAFAADLGTYRPGSPYHSVVAPGADVCESHCAGDAQCKGWNYVKVNPRAPGVCEFNTKSVSPIESAISISGAGGISAAPNLLKGNTNTIRVGTQARPQPRSRTVTVGQTPSGRRIVREAVPQRVQTRPTVARTPAASGSLTEQQNKYRQATGHTASQGYPQSRQTQPRAPQQASRPGLGQPQIATRQAAPQGQRLMRDPRIQAPQYPQGPRFHHNLDGATQGRPPIGVPIGPGGPQAAAPRRTAPVPQQTAMPRGSVNDPVTHSNGARRVQAAAQQQAQLTYEQAQQSLYGSLNDDVQAPRPLMGAPLDPNAPIPTSQARPTQPIPQSSLGVLAGPPAR